MKLLDVKLLDQKWFMFLVTFVFLEPYYFFFEAGFVNTLYKGAMILFLLVGAWLAFRLKEVPSIVLVFAVAYFAILGIAQVLIAKTAFIYLRESISVISLCLFCWMGMRHNPVSLMGGLALSFEVLLYANILTLLIFPHGMNQSDYNGVIAWENWLLGYRNIQIRTLLPGACVSLMYSHMTTKKVSLRAILFIVFTGGTILYIKSATSLIGYVVFAGLLLCFMRRPLPRWFNIASANAVAIVVFVLIVTVGIQQLFSFLIVNVLQRNLDFTNRDVVWRTAWTCISQSPLWGRGDFRVSNLLGLYAHPHNYWLNILLRGGIMLCIPVVMAYVFATRGTIKSKERILTKYLVITMVSFAAMGIVESLTEADMIFPLLLIAHEMGRKDLSLPEEKTLEGFNLVKGYARWKAIR